MVSIMAEARFWTARRIATCVGVLLVLTLGMPIAMGFTAAQLAKVDPAHDWRTIALTATMALFFGGILVGTMLVWRDYRRHLVRDAVDPWTEREAATRIKVSAIWRDCALVGFVLGIAAMLATRVPAGAPRVALATIAGLALVYGMVRGTVYYMRTIDEQERDANLWGGYCGMTVYAVLYFLQHLAGSFGVVVPHVHDAIFGIALIVTAGVYFWKRFR